MFHTGTPSHASWVRFVNQIPGSLADVRKWLAHGYQAQLHVADNCWWIQFPDAETRVTFELTWL